MKKIFDFFLPLIPLLAGIIVAELPLLFLYLWFQDIETINTILSMRIVEIVIAPLWLGICLLLAIYLGEKLEEKL